jgi:hypothetical protein
MTSIVHVVTALAVIVASDSKTVDGRGNTVSMSTRKIYAVSKNVTVESCGAGRFALSSNDNPPGLQFEYHLPDFMKSIRFHGNATDVSNELRLAADRKFSEINVLGKKNSLSGNLVEFFIDGFDKTGSPVVNEVDIDAVDGVIQPAHL